MKRSILAAIAVPALMVSLTGAAPQSGEQRWNGEVQPGSGWLKRQGLAPSFAIEFTMDAAGAAVGTIQFTGNSYPAISSKAVLKGNRDPDGSAYYLFATIPGRADLPAAAREQAKIEITLTGFDEEDGSLQGVATLDMADLACVTNPVRSAAKTPCARRKVPAKWTAKK
jgi:hypothetical protein